MFNAKRLFGYLATGEMPEMTALDESLAEHDKKYHPDGYKEGDSCNKRETMAGGDVVDKVEVKGQRSEVKQRNGTSSDRGNGVTAEDDAAYLDAVKRGDMETCAKMVREAAARAMPDTKVVDDDGLPLVVYHGTSKRFTSFDINRSGERSFEDFGRGIYLTKDFNMAKRYAVEALMDHGELGAVDEEKKDNIIFGRYSFEDVADKSVVMGLFVNVSKPKTVGFEDEAYSGMSEDASKHGHDGLIIDNGYEIVTFKPSQIKSADPVTYDDDGQPIPLSRRFDFSSDDIRY